jgi:hypothetical protein
MSIANELSSEIAAAMLSQQASPGKEASVSRNVIKDVVIEVHDTLRHLTIEARKYQRSTRRSSEPPPTALASGAN